MSTHPWELGTPLAERTTWLLEASAGTGKTYQIAALFVRLVAEYGLPIEGILTITFTTAATAELRERIRARLRDAMAALEGQEVTADPLIVHLISQAPRETMVLRLKIALLNFDLAPISTIHSFAQRTLSELAFDSGQDSGLELLKDARELIDELVDDALATLYAAASADLVALFEDFAFRRETLVRVAKVMTSPAEPEVFPKSTGDAEAQMSVGRAWLKRVETMRATFAAHRDAATAGLIADHGSGLFQKDQVKWLTGSIDKLGAWLSQGAGPEDLASSAFQRLTTSGRTAVWKGAPEALRTRPYWALAESLDAFFEAHRQLRKDFAPLSTFAGAVRARFEGELQRKRVLTFDAMLSRLAARMKTDEGSDAAPIAARLRERYPAVFVDEFQDTDEAQWQVIRAAFHGHSRLLLIGDPKQAIYGFRGADVQVYLEAKSTVPESEHRTMTTNFRSDPNAVEAMNTLFREDSNAFDEKGIDYVCVAADKPARLEPPMPGLVVRWVDARVYEGPSGEGKAVGHMPRGLLANMAARETLAWLDGSRRVRDVAVEPRHLAVLVGTHHEGSAVRKALARVGVPAVGDSRSTVFASPVAAWLAAWLDGVGAAGRDRDARAAAVTPLIGWSATQLAWSLAIASRGERSRADARARGVAVGDEHDFGAWSERLHKAAERWRKAGFFCTFDRESTDLGILPRVLRMPEGERHATDLRHLCELLHIEERTQGCSASELATWLRMQANAGGDETAQRLESDASAVRVETIHVSKGLQYPVVLLPFASGFRHAPRGGHPVLVRPGGGAAPQLHLHASGTAEASDAATRAKELERREDLRKAYVAFTRAEHQTVVTVGPLGKGGGPLATTAYGRLLMRDPDGKGYDDPSIPKLDAKEAGEDWERAQTRLQQLVERGHGSIAWVPEAAVGRLDSFAPGAGSTPELTAEPWTCGRRSLAGSWKVTSYTGLSGSHDREEKIGDEPPALEGDDGAQKQAERATKPSIPSPRYGALAPAPALTKGSGKEYGTWVHKVLEQVDFVTGEPRASAGSDWLEEAARMVGYAPTREILGDVRAHLPGVLATPLDSVAGGAPGAPEGLCLSSITNGNRLDELRFDLSLGHGTQWKRAPHDHGRDAFATRPGCVDPAGVHAALELAKDPSLPGLSAWLDQVAARHGAPVIPAIAGILTGSIDLVFRAGPTGRERYYLADYKTNKIMTSSPGHFTRAFMDAKMAEMNYYLQSLIYTVALHRYLEQRVRDYTYESHMGEMMYLFLRGMSGHDTQRDSGRCLGVFAHRWPEPAIVGLDRALGGSARGAS